MATERQRIIEAAKKSGWSVLTSGHDDLVLSRGADTIVVSCNKDHTVRAGLINEHVITHADRSRMAKIIQAVRS